MRNFFLGTCCGLVLGSVGAVFAQLVPFDAPLADQIQAQRSEWYLRTQRELERMEADTRRSLFDESGRPCR